MYAKVLTQHFHGGTAEEHELHARMDDLKAETELRMQVRRLTAIQRCFGQREITGFEVNKTFKL